MALPLLAFLLLAADPPSGPVSTAPAEAQAPAPAPAGDASADPDYLPKGAPADDFAFTAWCRGVLSGHMDLGQRIKDVLPLDPTQEEIGHAYLRGYDRALQGSPEAKTVEGKKRAEAARKDGWDRWEAARNASKLLQRDTYLAYQLPGRCEHAAIRLSNDPGLFRHAPSADEVAAMPITLSDGTTPPTAPAASAPPGPQPAPAAGDAPPPPHSGDVADMMAGGDAGAQATGGGATAPEPGAVATAPAGGDAATPVAASTAAPTDKAEAKPAERGHLLPPFLRKHRKKKPDETTTTPAPAPAPAPDQPK